MNIASQGTPALQLACNVQQHIKPCPLVLLQSGIGAWQPAAAIPDFGSTDLLWRMSKM